MSEEIQMTQEEQDKYEELKEQPKEDVIQQYILAHREHDKEMKSAMIYLLFSTLGLIIALIIMLL